MSLITFIRSMSITEFSMILGILGSLSSAVYVLNRLLYWPRVSVEACEEQVTPNQITLRIATKARRGTVLIEDVALHYDPFRCDVDATGIPHEYMVERQPVTDGPSHALHLPGLEGYVTERGGRIQWVKVSPASMQADSMVRLDLVVRAIVPEDSIPWLIDMFPAKARKIRIVKEYYFSP